MIKKSILWMVVACSAAMCFSACSDNKDNEGLGKAGSGVTVLPKKVVMIVRSTGSGYSDTTYFSYDGKGRVNRMIENGSEILYAYDNDLLTIREVYEHGEDEVEVYSLKSGRVTKYREEYGIYKDDYTFSYIKDYLSRVDYVSKVETQTDELEVFTYTVKDGNLREIKDEYRDMENEEGTPEIYTTTFEYGNVANNANIDLGYLLYDRGVSRDLTMLGVVGKRYRNLPSKVTETEENGYTEMWSITYEVKDDYVVGMTVSATDSETQAPSIEKYVIVYE